jgi:hypothetical protein
VCERGTLCGEWEPRDLNAVHFGRERGTAEQRVKRYNDFLAAAGLTPEAIATQLEQKKTNNEQEIGMAKKTKAVKAAKQAAAKKFKTPHQEKSEKQSTSARVKIFDNSAYKIAVTLGADGVSLARTKAIIKAQGSDLAEGTIQQNYYLGKAGKGNQATLTKEQKQTLLDSAAEPAAA